MGGITGLIVISKKLQTSLNFLIEPASMAFPLPVYSTSCISLGLVFSSWSPLWWHFQQGSLLAQHSTPTNGLRSRLCCSKAASDWVSKDAETMTRINHPLSQRPNCCRSTKYIRWHIPVHAIFAIFYPFSYLFYLGHLSLLGLQTKTRRQSNSSTFSGLERAESRRVALSSGLYLES